MKNIAFIGDSQRREFIKKSAKMGVALGAVATFGDANLFGADKSADSKRTKDSNQKT